MERPNNDHVSPALRLPETLGKVLQFLSVADRGQAAQVCGDWQEACRQPSVWQGAECTLATSRNIDWEIIQQRKIKRFIFQEEDDIHFWLDDLLFHVEGIESLDFSSCENIPDEFVQFAFNQDMPKMTTLMLRECQQLDDDSVDVILSAMPNLERLDLGRCFSLTDASLQSVGEHLPRIKELDLTMCSLVTDEGIGNLTTAGRPSTIERLGLVCCSLLTAAAVHHLTTMTRLRDLDISGCIGIGDDGMSIIYTMTNLQALDLACCHAISTLRVDHLAKMSSLRKLVLENCSNVSIAGLLHKGGFQSGITNLNVLGCRKLGSGALAVIATRLQQLEVLVLDECHISDRGVALATRFLRQLKSVIVVPMHG